MKKETFIVIILLAAGILFVGYDAGWAVEGQGPVVGKIGVVSVRQVFEKCEANDAYIKVAEAEQDTAMAELEKLQKEIEAEEASLKTLKAGTEDHMNQMKSVLEKQASLQAQKEYYKRQIELKDQQWTENLYQQVIQQASIIAEQKGLEVVMTKNEIDFPATSANELMLTIRTNNVLYSGGCVDITKEVIAAIDVVKE